MMKSSPTCVRYFTMFEKVIPCLSRMERMAQSLLDQQNSQDLRDRWFFYGKPSSRDCNQEQGGGLCALRHHSRFASLHVTILFVTSGSNGVTGEALF